MGRRKKLKGYCFFIGLLPEQFAGIRVITANAAGEIQRGKELSVIAERKGYDITLLFNRLQVAQITLLIKPQSGGQSLLGFRYKWAFLFFTRQSLHGITHRGIIIPFPVCCF